MVRNAHRARGLLACLVVALGGIGFAGVVILGSTVAHADIASAKAVVDAAKAKGLVGEQGDGYLGLVQGSASASVRAAVSEINAGRATVYRQTAARAGVTPQAAAEAAAQQIIAGLPTGQFYKPLGGGWRRK